MKQIRKNWGILLLLILPILLRRHFDAEVFVPPMGDVNEYIGYAANLLKGGYFGFREGPDNARAPLYSAMLALFSWCTGRIPLRAAADLNLIFDTITIFALYRIGRRVSGAAALRRRAASNRTIRAYSLGGIPIS